jgi:hypothetical protein
VLDMLAQEFEPAPLAGDGQPHARKWHEDTAALRRYLVDEGFLDRGRGLAVWRRSLPDRQARNSQVGHRRFLSHTRTIVRCDNRRERRRPRIPVATCARCSSQSVWRCGPGWRPRRRVPAFFNDDSPPPLTLSTGRPWRRRDVRSRGRWHNGTVDDGGACVRGPSPARDRGGRLDRRIPRGRSSRGFPRRAARSVARTSPTA